VNTNTVNAVMASPCRQRYILLRAMPGVCVFLLSAFGVDAIALTVQFAHFTADDGSLISQATGFEVVSEKEGSFSGRLLLSDGSAAVIEALPQEAPHYILTSTTLAPQATRISVARFLERLPVFAYDASSGLIIAADRAQNAIHVVALSASAVSAQMWTVNARDSGTPVLGTAVAGTLRRILAKASASCEPGGCEKEAALPLIEPILKAASSADAAAIIQPRVVEALKKRYPDGQIFAGPLVSVSTDMLSIQVSDHAQDFHLRQSGKTATRIYQAKSGGKSLRERKVKAMHKLKPGNSLLVIADPDTRQAQAIVFHE